MIRMALAAVLLLAFGLTAYSSLDQVQSSSQKVDLKKMKATIERLEKPVTLEFVDSPFSDVLELLKEFTKIEFGWDFEVLPATQPIAFSAQQQPLGEVLQKLLDQFQWTYAVQPDGGILLRPVPKPSKK